METTDSAVRVRFAPSPTGLLHIGGLRTALYNYLFARNRGGKFILRIEDTDQERYVDGAEEDILESLEWAGLEYDEGVRKGGPHDPYRQSERKALYKQYADQLLEKGYAYIAFDSPDEIEAMRRRMEAQGVIGAKYDASTRTQMSNSLTLPEEEVKRRLESGQDYVVRLKVPRGESVRFDDLIRGSVTFESSVVDDQVLIKSDGMPTYHLANVVDDHLMGVTHVIRGEEWLPSTPKHILLYQFLGWTPPQWAHLPLILSPEGGKLSKRSADKIGIPVSVRQYRDAGYEPQALVNFLAFLGWNPGTEQEIFSLDELVEAFTIERVGSSGVQFNLDKLHWYNQQYLRRLSPEELTKRVRPFIEKHGFTASDEYVREVAILIQERITLAEDVALSSPYFFVDPESYEEQGVKKRWKEDSAELVTAFADRLEHLEVFESEQIEQSLRELAEARGVGTGRIIHPTRIAVSGVSFGPSLFHMMAVLGKETCRRRMYRAAEVLG